MILWISRQVSVICQKSPCLLATSQNTLVCSPGLSWSLYSSTGHPDTSGLNHLSTLHAADHSILFVVCQNRALRTEAFFPEPLLPLLVQAVHVRRGDLTEVHSCLMRFLYYQRLLTTVLWTSSHWEYLSAPKGVTCFWLRFSTRKTVNNLWQSKRLHSWLHTYSPAPASALTKFKLRKAFPGHVT